jgi:DNA (cytosine-5)-methyltransferase 1
VRFGSVCSGIEAASAAWEPLGWQPAWFAEIAPWPSKFLSSRFPSVPNHGSLVGLADRLAGDARSIDVLVGGTPCQSFSVAGLRGGLADERGNLALEFARLAAALRPRWLVWENVPGVLSSDGGRAFASLVRGLSELGYGLAWRVLDAQFFGVAQRRERVFLVGHLGAAAAAGAVLFEPEGVRRNSPTRSQEGEDIAGPLASLSGGSRLDLDGHGAYIPEGDRWPKEVAPTLNAHFGDKLGLENQHALGGAGLFVPEPFFVATAEGGRGVTLTVSNLNPGTNNQSPLVCFDETQVTSPGNRSLCGPETAALTKTGRPPAIAFNARQNPVSSEHVTGSLDTNGATQAVCVTGTRVRRLTPRECERLQGFPDDWTAVDGAKDTPRYAALGNSMAVPVMRWLGRRIELVDGILRGNS